MSKLRCHISMSLAMQGAGRLDGPDLLEPHLRVPEVVEQASAAAEQHPDDVTHLKYRSVG
jgi:hypothetical protein